MRVRGVIAGFAAAAVVLLAPAAPAHAASGTAVCGVLPSGTTTWTATAAPYHICATGILVPQDATLDIDALLGSVAVFSDAGGEIDVNGTLETQHTSVLARVSMGPVSGSSWDGIFAGGANGAYADQMDYQANSIDIEGADLTGGMLSVRAATVTFANSTTTGTVTASGPSVSVSSSTITGTDCTGGYGYENFISGSQDSSGYHGSVSITGSTMTGGCGLAVNGGAVTMTNNRIDSVNAEHAPVFVDGSYSLGPAGSISGNTGAHDPKPYMDLRGQEGGGFTWTAVPTDSSSEQPLGYEPDGMVVNGPGTVTIPASSTVYGTSQGIELRSATLDGTAGGSTLQCPPSPAGGCTTQVAAHGGATSAPAAVQFNHMTVQGDLNVSGPDDPGSTPTFPPSAINITNSTINGSAYTRGFATAAITSSRVTGINVTAPAGQTDTVSNVDSDAISAGAANTANVVVTGNTVHTQTWGGAPVDNTIGIIVGASDGGTLTVTNNTVIGPGPIGTQSRPAMQVSGPDLQIGPGGNVDGNVGMGNGSDSIAIGGTLTRSLTWSPARHNTSVAPLGLIMGTLDVAPGLTLTVPQGATVASAGAPQRQWDSLGSFGPDVTFTGSTLDASAGGAAFLHMSLRFQADSAGDPAHGAIDDASTWDTDIHYAAPGYDSPYSSATPMAQPGLTINGLTMHDLGDVVGVINRPTVESDGAPLSIRGLSLHGMLRIYRADGTTIDHSVIYDADDYHNAVQLDASSATITHSRLISNQGWGVIGTGAVTMSCDVVTGNAGGVAAGSGSIHDSDVYDNTGRPVSLYSPIRTAYDVDATGSAVDASSVWWGQAGGPTAGQTNGDVTADSPLSAPATCASDAPQPPAPTAVSDLAAAPTSTTSLHLTWSNPTWDADWKSVVVRMAPGSTPPVTPSDGTALYTGAGSSADATGLTAGRTYSFSVFSVSPFTPSTSITTLTTTTPMLHGSRVSASLSTPRVTWRNSDTLHVTVADAVTSNPIGNEQVTVQSRPHGATAWRFLTNATTSNSGVVDVMVQPEHNTDYRVVYPGDASHSSASTAPTTLSVRSAAWLYTDRAIVNLGASVTLTGSVRPSAPKLSVALQQHRSDGWHIIRWITLNSGSGFSTTYRVTSTGYHTYRLMVPPTPTNLRGWSAAIAIASRSQ